MTDNNHKNPKGPTPTPSRSAFSSKVPKTFGSPHPEPTTPDHRSFPSPQHPSPTAPQYPSPQHPTNQPIHQQFPNPQNPPVNPRPQPLQPSPGDYHVPESGFRTSNSGFHSDTSGFHSDTSGFKTTGMKAPKGQRVTSISARAIYGASGFFGGTSIGLFLGFLNSALQGVGMLEYLGTVMEIALWLGAFIGFLAALKPLEFERVFENLREKLDD